MQNINSLMPLIYFLSAILFKFEDSHQAFKELLEESFVKYPPLFTSSSYVPSSTTLPLFNTIILSQLFIVDNRCAMIICVVSFNLSIVYYVNLLVLGLFVKFLYLMLMLLNLTIIFLACGLELSQLIHAVFDLQTTAYRKDQLSLRIHRAINLNLFQKSIHLFLKHRSSHLQ